MEATTRTFFRALCLAFCFASSYSAYSQSILDKRISLSFDNLAVELALELIEEQGGFVFSYASNLIPDGATTSVHASNRTIREVLLVVIGDEVRYLERGSYVIIKAKKTSKKDKQKFEIEGQLVDANTGENISNATIYEVNKLKSTVSSSSGHYNLNVKEKSEYVELVIAKENYKDTLLRLRKEELKDLVIELEPIPPSNLYDKNSAADSLALVKMFVNKEAGHNMNNVSLYEKRPAQISFLPILGTNKLMSGKTTNNLSVNIIAGYSYAVHGLEAGGFANIVRQNVYGVQAAGFMNIVGGKTSGLQAAGFANVTKMKFNGIQVSGFSNTVANEVRGAQVCGFVNVAPSVRGAQIAGFVNTVWDTSWSSQFAGFVNFANTNRGSQWSGFTNVTAKKLSGVQATGFLNYARDLKGLQMAGFANVTLKEVRGVQMAPVLNYAGKLRGIQIGLINVCDTVESGVSLGFLSFVRRGLHDLELQYSQSLHANLQYKTGTNRLYTLLAVAHRLDMPVWAVGYGIGSKHQFKGGFLYGAEIQTNYVQGHTNLWRTINSLNQFYPFFGFRFSKEMAITMGPVYNLYYSQWLNPDTQEFGHPILTNPFQENTTNKGRVQMELGYKVALIF